MQPRRHGAVLFRVRYDPPTAPFRDAVGGEVFACPTSGGTLQLELAPHHVALALADLQLVIARGTLTVTRAVRRSVRRVVRPIGSRLMVARGRPSEGVGLWLEDAPGEVERVFGVEPHDLYAADGLWALRQLDRLARRLGQAVNSLGRGVKSALEVGPRSDHGSRFRQRARCVLDAWADGRVVLPTPRGESTIRCRSRFAVQVIGDYLRFTSPAGDDLARIYLPWLSREDREELVGRIGAMVERRPLLLLAATDGAPTGP